MKESWRRSIKRIGAMLSLLCLTLCLTLPAMAAESSITVLHEWEGKAIPGMTVSLYQAAEQTETGLMPRPGYEEVLSKESIETLGTANAETIRNMARNLKQLIELKKLSPLETVQSDESGRVKFQTGIQTGIYLISYQRVGNFSAEPSLIAIPLQMKSQDGSLVSTVNPVIHAKVEYDRPDRPDRPGRPPRDDDSPPPPTPPETPNSPETPTVAGAERPIARVLGAIRAVATGDSSLLKVYGYATILSGLALMAWIAVRKKETEED